MTYCLINPGQIIPLDCQGGLVTFDKVAKEAGLKMNETTRANNSKMKMFKGKES